MVKRFVKYIPSNNYGFFDDADYVYFNSKKWFAVDKDGSKKQIPSEHPKSCVNQDIWVEAGPVVRNKFKYYKGPINPNKTYLFIEYGYIWFADGERVIKDKLNNGYILKTKKQLDEECYVGPGKFIVELP